MLTGLGRRQASGRGPRAGQPTPRGQGLHIRLWRPQIRDQQRAGRLGQQAHQAALRGDQVLWGSGVLWSPERGTRGKTSSHHLSGSRDRGREAPTSKDEEQTESQPGVGGSEMLSLPVATLLGVGFPQRPEACLGGSHVSVGSSVSLTEADCVGTVR